MNLRLKEKRKVNQAEFGKIVARALGRERPLTKMTVSRWESGEAVPDIATLGAIAQVAEVDPGWLTFGEKSGARPPWSDTSSAQTFRRASELQWELVHAQRDELLGAAEELDRQSLKELGALAGKLDRKSNKRRREILASLESGGEITRMARSLGLHKTDEEADEVKLEEEREERDAERRAELAADARLDMRLDNRP